MKTRQHKAQSASGAMLALEAHILINRRRSPSHAMLLRILRPCAADRHTPAFSSRAAASSLPERASRERPEVQATRAGYHPRICVECRLRPAGAHRSLSFSIIYGLPISSGLIRRNANRQRNATRSEQARHAREGQDARQGEGPRRPSLSVVARPISIRASPDQISRSAKLGRLTTGSDWDLAPSIWDAALAVRETVAVSCGLTGN